MRSIKNLYKNFESSQIVLLFSVWKIYILIFGFLSVFLLPIHSSHFFGGGLGNYLQNPLFWGWANFDGEHYLSIAQKGYKNLEHSFFPAYPLLIKYLTRPFGLSDQNVIFIGVLVSNLSLAGSLFLMRRLILLDYSKNVSFFSLLSLLFFPTSFYLGAMYTESFFLFCTLSSFYFARKKVWLFSGIMGAVASATRVVGVLLLPALVVELAANFPKEKNKAFLNSLCLCFVPVGLLFYMSFLGKSTGNVFAFYTSLSTFGEQRQTDIILLPQVFVRYLKMLLGAHLDLVYLAVSLELVAAILCILLLGLGFLWRVRLSYLVFAVLGFMLPTLTGSFSSLPRYVFSLFPIFIVGGIFLSKRNLMVRLTALAISLGLLGIETALFLRGYWVA